MLTKIGLDLGYANITLSNVAAEVYREPSVVLLDKNSRRVISVGNLAAVGGEEVYREDGVLVRPFKNGLLYSSDLTREIIKYAVGSMGITDKIRCIIALPSDMIPKQEGEIFKMLNDAGVEECYSVKPAMAALIGAGYSPTISAVSVNVGASYTEIAVIHKGEIIVCSREAIGGEDFDIAVKDYILESGDMAVSLLVARTIKERLGAVWQGRENESIDIEGTLSLTGGKLKMSICTEDIVGVFEQPLKKLLLAVANVIKKIPADKVNDIFENGIVLTGGGAEIYGLDVMMKKVLGISVTKPVRPIDSVAKGLARINTFIPLKMRGGAKNITSQLAKLYESKTANKNK
jgi:rod shape-determining protein MreB